MLAEKIKHGWGYAVGPYPPNVVLSHDGTNYKIEHWPTANPPTIAEIEAVVLPTPVVQQISRRQGRLFLHQMGLLEQVEAAITATGKVAEIFYESEVWLRSDTFVNSLGQQLGLSSEQLDEMFNAASLL